jgi:hypothetical protein
MPLGCRALPQSISADDGPSFRMRCWNGMGGHEPANWKIGGVKMC